MDVDRSYYEFHIDQSDGRQATVRANYFDAGYYQQDPVIYNGVTVRATYRVWTDEAITITAMSGRHAGWAYQESTDLDGWLLAGAGIIFLAKGVRHAINESFTKRPSVRHNSTSILGI